MATNVVSSAIVPEVLTKDNCANWSVCVKNYLLGQDLWDIVETESKLELKTWRKKNAMALHAIQISCGPYILSQIREISSAKEAWDFLAKMHEPHSQGVSEPISLAGDPELMDQRLNDAAQAGDIEAMYDLIKQDPLVLEKVDKVPFSDTPLHVAIRANQTCFAKEVASLKPSFAEKLNEDGLNPMHLATETGQVEMVKELLTINPGLCLLKGKEKRIPLHFAAAAAGTVDVMEKILLHSPESILELTIRNETTIHLAAKNNQLEAFKMLLEWLEKLYIAEVDRIAEEIVLKGVNFESLRAMVGRIKLLNKVDFNSVAISLGHGVQAYQTIRETLKQIKKEEVLNWKDNEGNTVLHLATFSKNRQMINLMIGRNSFNWWEVDVNAKNASGQTALDVLFDRYPRDEERVKIANILRQAGALTALEVIDHLPPSAPNAPTRCLRWSLRFVLDTMHLIWTELGIQFTKVSPSEARNALLVVAVLIATATFQAGVSPPGGLWQDNNIPYYSNNNTSPIEMVPHIAGTAILGTYLPGDFIKFIILNYLGFLLSLFMINFLTEGFPLQGLLTLALVSIYGSYSLSILSITPPYLGREVSLALLLPVGVIGGVIFLLKFYLAYKDQSLASAWNIFIYMLFVYGCIYLPSAGSRPRFEGSSVIVIYTGIDIQFMVINETPRPFLLII